MKNNSYNFSLSLIAFMAFGIYGNTFNILRQMLGISIFTFAMKYLLNRDFKKYMLIVLIACLFHRSIIIMLPVYFIVNIDYKKITYYLLPMIMIFFNLTKITKKLYLAILNLSFIPQKYINEYSNGEFVEKGFNFKYILIVLIIYYAFLILQRYIEKKDSKRYLILLNLTLILTILGIGSIDIWILYRLFVVLQIVLILLIPEFLKAFKKKDEALLSIIIIICSLVVFVYTTKAQNGILPYETIYNIYGYNKIFLIGS